MHLIKCEKNKNLPMELLDLMVYFFPLIFFNELTIKIAVSFGGFVKF
jgi:hypothetical protein